MSATSTRASHAARLAGYLAVGIAGSALSSGDAEAAVVSIDVGATGFNLLGTNAGLSAPGIRGVGNFPITGPAFVIKNVWGGTTTGLYGTFSGSNVLQFAQIGIPFSRADPKNFSASASIDSSSSFDFDSTYFRTYNGGWQTSADFGAGSYMGFRFSTNGGTDWNYGYLEITWNSTTRNFQIFSAAYESTANTGILAGGAAPVPGAGGLMALMALGGGAFRRRGRAA